MKRTGSPDAGLARFPASTQSLIAASLGYSWRPAHGEESGGCYTATHLEMRAKACPRYFNVGRVLAFQVTFRQLTAY